MVATGMAAATAYGMAAGVALEGESGKFAAVVAEATSGTELLAS